MLFTSTATGGRDQEWRIVYLDTISKLLVEMTELATDAEAFT